MRAVLAAIAFAFTTTGLAQSDHDSHHKMEQPTQSSAAQPHKATGVVTKVDAAGSRVTIRHEAVQSLNWPAMTMGFKVNDKKMLSTVKPGAKVEFDFEQQGKDYVITQMR